MNKRILFLISLLYTFSSNGFSGGGMDGGGPDACEEEFNVTCDIQIIEDIYGQAREYKRENANYSRYNFRDEFIYRSGGNSNFSLSFCADSKEVLDLHIYAYNDEGVRSTYSDNLKNTLHKRVSLEKKYFTVLEESLFHKSKAGEIKESIVSLRCSINN